MTNLTALPENLPPPMDDGAAKHLLNAKLPSVPLLSTIGTTIDIGTLRGLTIIYCYPMTGRPDVPLPEDWDLIPGARGCTPQACSYRDHHAELRTFGAELFALSTQSHEYQKEMATRLHLTFPVLSDESLQLTETLSLPTFQSGGRTLLKRLTLICRDSQIIHVNYPVFPPDKDVETVIAFLRELT